MGDVGSERYRPPLLPPCPTIRVFSILWVKLMYNQPSIFMFKITKIHSVRGILFANIIRIRKDKDLFMCPQEFVVGYSKAPEQPQSSARPICHSHAMTRTGREPATIRIAA